MGDWLLWLYCDYAAEHIRLSRGHYHPYPAAAWSKAPQTMAGNQDHPVLVHELVDVVEHRGASEEAEEETCTPHG